VHNCTLPTHLHLDRQYSAKIPLFLYVEAKVNSFSCSTVGLVVEEQKSQEYSQTHKVYAPLAQRDIWHSSELIRLIDTSDRTCMRELRMSRPVFYKLCARLRERGLLVDTLHVSVEQLTMFFEDCWAIPHTFLCSNCNVEIGMDSEYIL